MMTKKPHRILAALLASSTLAIVATGCGPSTPDAKEPSGEAGPAGDLVGKAAPDFSAESITGEGPTSLKDAKGTVVILDFWATFCGPCKKSFPKYQELVEAHGGELNVIAVSTDEDEPDTKDKITEFAKTTGAKFAVVWDKNHEVVKVYPTPTMPTAYVIDKEGVVRHVHVGYKDREDEKIAEEVKALLGK